MKAQYNNNEAQYKNNESTIQATKFQTHVEQQEKLWLCITQS
jgi:hypothetical protein